MYTSNSEAENKLSLAELIAAGSGDQGNSAIIELQKDAVYEISEAVQISHRISIRGNGAQIRVNGLSGFVIKSSDVTLENLTLSGGVILIDIDSDGSLVENISIKQCVLKDYYLTGLRTGSSKSNGVCRNISVVDCSFAARENINEQDEKQVVALDMLLLAAHGETDDISHAKLDNVLVERCNLQGPSICNLMLVPGLALNQDRTPQFNRCSISNILIRNCNLTGSDDTVLAAQANYINNNDCYFENLEAVNNTCEFGLTGLSASGGSPMLGDCDGIYIKNIKFNDNVLCGKPDVGETRTAIIVSGGGINYYSCSCHNSYVKNMEIQRNSIRNCENGIFLVGGSSMVDSDAPNELCGNYIEDVVVRNNKLFDVQNCFSFYGARLEGRRFDWNWGKHHTTQFWQPHVEDNRVVTTKTCNNHIRNLVCEENHCFGFSYLLHAIGASGRGHGIMENNSVVDGIVFRNNTFNGGENHIYVAHGVFEDWVRDNGGNVADLNLKNI